MVHVMFASVWGYAIARAHFGGRSRLLAAALGLALAALLHGLFDFVTLGLSHWVRIVPPLLILAIWLWRMHRIERIRE